MSPVLTIAREEWRYWQRSKLLRAATLLALLLLLSAIAVTHDRVVSETAARLELQQAAEAAFTSQPDRHPHRMVHYGHYVFRTPPPLAVVDPGVDGVTGTTLFLEGHRQNSAAFPPGFAQARPGALGHLTPAFVYQVILPLLLVLLAHSGVTREREGATDLQLLASGITTTTLWAGKALALGIAVAVLVLPLAAVSLHAITRGEEAMLSGVFLLAYTLYLATWALGALAISAVARCTSDALPLGLGLWVTLTLIAPPTVSSLARAAHPTPSRLAQDVALTRELRQLGDGHNENDPAFARLRANLLEEYEVDRVEDLPINFRGIVAQRAEADLTELLNRYAEQRYASQAAQAGVMYQIGLTMPGTAISQFSRISAGTDLATHHRFLREGEAARYALVQQLNGLHASEMRYADDINRSRDAAAEQRTRVSAHHWRALEDFRFQPAAATERLSAAAAPLAALTLWFVVATVVSLRATRWTHG